MSDGLARLARQAGVVDHWIDASGYRHAIDARSTIAILSSMGLDCGDYIAIARSLSRLDLARSRPPLLTTWVGVPTRLPVSIPANAHFSLVYEDGELVEGRVHEQSGSRWLPPVLHAGYHRVHGDGFAFGLAVAPLRACGLGERQSPRSRHWGLSLDGQACDFGTLAAMARVSAGHGADALGVGSLAKGHRLWLDTSRVSAASFFESIAHGYSVAAGPATSSLKQWFRDRLPRDEALLREFLRFSHDGGDTLLAHARHLAQATESTPAPTSRKPDRLDFGDDLPEDIGYQIFLLWLAHRGKLATQAAAIASGMSIGLVVDLDWGADPWGSEVADASQTYLGGLRVGDPLDSRGIAASADDRRVFDPRKLVAQGFRPWIALLRSTMAGVGAIRLPRFDRWRRVWLMPADGAGGGAFLEQPFDDLLRLLVLESVRQRCLVIIDGKPDGIEDAWLAARQAGLLAGNTVLRYSDAAGWVPGSHWHEGDCVASSDRGTPGLREWWEGDDIRRRLDGGHLGETIAAREFRLRESERGRLLEGLGLPPRRSSAAVAVQNVKRNVGKVDRPANDGPPAGQEVRLIDAVISAIGRSPVPLAMIAIDDLLADQNPASGALLAERGDPLHRLDAGIVRNRLHRLDRARCEEIDEQPLRLRERDVEWKG